MKMVVIKSAKTHYISTYLKKRCGIQNKCNAHVNGLSYRIDAEAFCLLGDANILSFCYVKVAVIAILT